MPFARSYCRVSHMDSARTDLSPQTQMAMNRRCWDMKCQLPQYQGVIWAQDGWQGTKHEGVETTDGHYVDRAVSAFRRAFGARPAGSRLEAQLQEGDVIIISYLDRAFRSIRDAVNTLHRWDAMGVRVIIVGLDIDTGTPMGKLIISILAAVAQFQSDLMSEKNRAVQQHRKRQGFLASGTIPFGFKRASRNKDSQNYKRLVADNEERRLIRRIAQLYESTDLTYDDISDLLEREAAEREGRSVLPRNGLRGTKHKHLPKRRWSFWRCKRAIAAYRNGLVPPPTDEPLPPEWAEREKAKAEKLGPDPMDP